MPKTKTDMLQLAADKFAELEKALSDKFELDGNYKTEASEINQRILKIKGELAMAFAMAQ